MKLFNLILFGLVILLFAISLSSCQRSNEPTSPIITTNLKMEIIPYQDVPVNVDSNLCYIKIFVSWNTSVSKLDTLKADSLAEWFAQSQYQITDMWFPDVESRCLNPLATENTVTIKLAQPDTSLKSQGFSSTSSAVDFLLHILPALYIYKG